MDIGYSGCMIIVSGLLMEILVVRGFFFIGSFGVIFVFIIVLR